MDIDKTIFHDNQDMNIENFRLRINILCAIIIPYSVQQTYIPYANAKSNPDKKMRERL